MEALININNPCQIDRQCAITKCHRFIKHAMQQRFSSKKIIYIQLALVSTLMLCGLFLSFYLAISPCVLCKLQRLILVSILGLILAKLYAFNTRWLYHIFNVLMLSLLVLSAVLAWHHMHLQLNPDPDGACLPSLEMMWQYFSWSKMLQSIFQSNVGCNEMTWQWMQLSIPQWLLLNDLLLIGLQCWEGLVKAPKIKKTTPVANL